MAMKPVDTAIAVVVGPLIDDTDFKTAETAVAYDAAGMSLTAVLERADGIVTVTPITPTGSTGGVYNWDHLGAGYYQLDLPANGGAHYNNDTEGVLRIVGSATGVLPFSSVAYDITAKQAYDSMVSGSDKLEVDVAQWRGSTPAVLADTDKVNVYVGNKGALNDLAAGAEMTLTSAYDAAKTAAQAAVCTETRLAELDAGNLPTDVAAVKTQAAAIETDTQDLQAQIGVDGAGLTAIGDTRIANLDTTVSSRLATTGYMAPDNTGIANVLAAVDTEIAGILAAVDTEVAAIKAKTDNLPASPAAVGSEMSLTSDYDAAKTAAQAAVCTEARLAELDAGNLPTDIAAVKAQTAAIETDTQDLQAQIGADGAGLTAIGDTRLANLDAAVSTRLATTGYTAPTSAAAIADAVWDESLADHQQSASAGNALDSATAPTAGEVADAVWEEAISDHSGTTGSTAEALNAAGSAGDPWMTQLPGSYGTGSAGKIVGDNLNATVSSRSLHSAADVKAAIEATGSSIAAIKAKTDNLPVSPAATGDAMTLTSAYDAAKTAAQATVCTEARLAELDANNLPTDVAAVKTQTAAIETDTQDLQAQIGVDGAGLTAIGDARLTNLDTTISSRLAASSYVAPDNADVVSILAAVDTEVAAIKAKTDGLPASPAATGDAMTLADDAITADKFDKTTAFPLTAIPPTAVEIKTAIEVDGSKLDHLWEMTTDTTAGRQFTEHALELAPSSTVEGGDASAANQALILADLEEIKGTGFVPDTNSLVNVTGATPVTLQIESEVTV